MKTQAEKAAAFRTLHERDSAFIIPNPWDMGTARLLAQLGFIEGTVLAFRELAWKFSLPVFIGDTIHVEAAVTGLRPLKRLGGGTVTFDIRVINQDGKCVQNGQWVLLVASRRE